MKKISLTKGLEAIVDEEDYKYLIKWRWCADKKGYAVRSERRSETGRNYRKMIYMHRVILPHSYLEIDHADGNVGNNQKSNLRIATHSENMRNRKLQKNNTSGYKGVWFNKKRMRFIASIKINGVSKTVGWAYTAEEAGRIYDLFAKKIYGKFARTNNDIEL
jgi:hypothetical protein